MGPVIILNAKIKKNNNIINILDTKNYIGWVGYTWVSRYGVGKNKVSAFYRHSFHYKIKILVNTAYHSLEHNFSNA